MVFSDKEIDNVLYKKVNNEISDRQKNIFEEAKKLFNLRVEIYKKLVLEKENSKFKKSIGETVKTKNQKDNLSETLEQEEFNDFSEQIKREQKNIDINSFKNYETPDKMPKHLLNLETTDDYNQATSLIGENFINFEDEV